MAAKTYLMKVSYDGRLFHGYQYQRDLRTVQGDIEGVLGHIFKRDISSQASGRTDAGVHARGQVISFSAPELMEIDRLHYVISRFLPEDIQLLELREDFLHPRYDALAKAYIYKCTYNDDVFKRPYSLYLARRLDISSMRRAASHLEGFHDFYNFSNRRKNEGSTKRLVHRIIIENKAQDLEFIFLGEGFLYKMVRIMVAYLINVGMGRYRASETPQVLKKRSRLETRQVSPAQGLYLDQVFYKEKDLWEYLKKIEV